MATTPTRIYTVLHIESGKKRLVRATHPAVSITHVANGAYSAAVATQDELVELLAGGTRVEVAGEEPKTAAAPAAAGSQIPSPEAPTTDREPEGDAASQASLIPLPATGRRQRNNNSGPAAA